MLFLKRSVLYLNSNPSNTKTETVLAAGVLPMMKGCQVQWLSLGYLPGYDPWARLCPSENIIFKESTVGRT
jgi:hypothetical protein